MGLNVTNIVTIDNVTINYTMPKFSKDGKRPDLDGLIESVADRGGLFTTAEAEKFNISRRLLSHYTDSGRLVRIARGIYRPKAFPTHRHEDLIARALSVGEGSVVAGPSALDVYLPGRLASDKVYVRRGPGERQPRMPKEYKVTTAVLDHRDQDNTVWDGVSVENAEDAFYTTSELNLLDSDQTSRIIDKAKEQGLIHRRARGIASPAARLKEMVHGASTPK